VVRPILFLAVFAVVLTAAESTPNQLSPEEAATGWVLLFDGKTFDGWVLRPSDAPPLWVIEDGCLHVIPQGTIPESALRQRRSDLLTRETFRDFDFRFEWRAAPGANSGVKYRLMGGWGRKVEPRAGEAETGFLTDLSALRTISSTGIEYQISDDEHEKDALSTPLHAAGAVYEYVPAKKSHPAAALRWHEARILVRGTHFEHWLDGEIVASGEFDSSEFRAALAATKRENFPRLFKPYPDHETPIALQHHRTEVWFRNLKVLRLEPK